MEHSGNNINMLTKLDLSSEIARDKHFPFVDVTKFICAFLVVAIHVPPCADIDPDLSYGVKQYLPRLAVPFFFVAGGYFCFRKTDYENFDSGRPIAYAKRMLKLYIIWTGIYLPIIIHSIVKSERGILYGVLEWIERFIFKGSYLHLWYLLAAAIATLIVCWVIKKRLDKKVVIPGALILYTIGLLGTSYHELLRPLESIPFIWEPIRLYELLFKTTSNGFFFGTIYVGMGAIFAYKNIYLRRSTAIMGFIISMLFMFAEVLCIKHFELSVINDMYVFLLPALFFLFYIATHIEIKETATTIAFRKYSSIIYFVHMWVYFIIIIIRKVLELLLNVDIKIHSLLKYTLVALGSLAIAIIVVELEKRKSFKWLKNIM